MDRYAYHEDPMMPGTQRIFSRCVLLGLRLPENSRFNPRGYKINGRHCSLSLRALGLRFSDIRG